MGKEELAVNFFEAEAAAKRHVRQECPTDDVRKRIIDVRYNGLAPDPSKVDVYHLLPGAMPPTVFSCRGCDWTIEENQN